MKNYYWNKKRWKNDRVLWLEKETILPLGS
jgi:hypothetical protein